MSTPTSLPKAGSGAFTELWTRVKRVLDLPRSVVVLEGALDRKTMEDALAKAAAGKLRAVGLPRAELVGRLADLFQQSKDGAFLLMRELDKGCHKERHIVTSIEEASVDARLATYKALDFRRERARLVWALVRDGRPACVAAAERVLDEAFHAMRDKDALASPGVPKEVVENVRQRLEHVESTIETQREQLAREQNEKRAVEVERAELMARLGGQQRALRDEEGLRKHADVEARRAKEEIAALQERIAALDPARIAALEEEAARLRDKVRALEKSAAYAEKTDALAGALAAANKRADDGAREAAAATAGHEAALAAARGREEDLERRLAEARAELKEARRAASGTTTVAAVAPGEERVGVFVDASNLQASGRREGVAKLDFLTLLPALVGARRKARAVAFLVNADDEPGGGGAFQGFQAALRQAGYETREKRPKVRPDGSRKADWDMGLAMEVLDSLDDVDTVVLASGDGDFIPLVQRLKRAGKKVEVAAFKRSADTALVAAADAFTALDETFKMAS